jgi:hypothetical protein
MKNTLKNNRKLIYFDIKNILKNNRNLIVELMQLIEVDKKNSQS